MNYAEFREKVLAQAGQQYGWVMLTQEKRDISRMKMLYSVEALVFGANLQGLIEADDCTDEWIADTVQQMIKTLNILSPDAQRRRDQG